MIKGETVSLIEIMEVGTDDFGVPVYAETITSVDNVLLGTPSFEAALADMQLHGKRLAYTLGIPKGDTHDWKDKDVYIRGEKFRTYGFPLTQTAENVPGPWNTQVKVERYE